MPQPTLGEAMNLQYRIMELSDSARAHAEDLGNSLQAGITRLPRLLRDLDSRKLDEGMIKVATNVVVATYMVASGKDLRLTVHDRRLNRFGQASAKISLALSLVMMPLYAHEKYMRSKTLKEYGEYLDALLREARSASAGRK